MVRPVKHPTTAAAVRRLAISQGLSYAGRGAALTALIWALYAATGSAWWLSAAMLAIFGASTAASPWTGHAGDRHDRRWVIMVSAWLAAAAFVACAALVWHGDTVATIAHSVGYTSEYAFSRAFTRARGLPPGRYRIENQASRA